MWGQDNPFFFHDTYVTPTGKRMVWTTHKQRKHIKQQHLTPQLADNNTWIWFNSMLTHIQDRCVCVCVCVCLCVCVCVCVCVCYFIYNIDVGSGFCDIYNSYRIYRENKV